MCISSLSSVVADFGCVSHAGVYCPTLAAEVLAHNKDVVPGAAGHINLVGMAVGDPCTDNDAQRQSMDMLWYAHNYITDECSL